MSLSSTKRRWQQQERDEARREGLCVNCRKRPAEKKRSPKNRRRGVLCVECKRMQRERRRV